MLANIKISYLYRDASNYKQFATVVLANPSNAIPDDIYATFGIAFRALQLHPDVIHCRKSGMDMWRCLKSCGLLRS